MIKTLTIILASMLVGGAIATHIRDTVIVNCNETPAQYRARVIAEAVATPDDNLRCQAIEKLFESPQRDDCTTDLDCEAKEEFNLQECDYDDTI